MDTDFSKKLQGFDRVWQRVQQQRDTAGHKGSGSQRPQQPPPPGRRNCSRTKRFKPGRY